jgi:hypothetical protein
MFGSCFWFLKKLLSFQIIVGPSLALVLRIFHSDSLSRQSPHPVFRISHSGSKWWWTLLGIEISCSQWKAQACTQGALLLFLLNFGRKGRGGENFYSFFFGSQCVPQHVQCSSIFPVECWAKHCRQWFARGNTKPLSQTLSWTDWQTKWINI